MRHALVVIGLGLLFTVAPWGDAHAGSPLEVETKMGFSYARFFGDAINPQNKTGFAGAIAVYVPMRSWLMLQTEIGYAAKGTSYGRVTNPIIDGLMVMDTFEQLWAVDYLELPVLLRTRSTGAMVRPSLIVGPVVGWKVVEKFVLNSSQGTDYQFSSDLGRALDFALSGGVALELGPVDRCVTLEARFTRGLTSASDPASGEWIGNRDVRFLAGWKTTWSSVFDRL